MAESKTLDEAAKPAAADKTIDFVCVTKCYWDGTLYHEGDIVKVAPGMKDKVPEHFEKK